jgi:hypothetical protein
LFHGIIEWCFVQQVPRDLGIEDVDKDDMGDVTLVALYAYDIFCYYKEREVSLGHNLM